MNFAQVIGQYYTKESLIQSVQKGRIPHAQLFLGKTGWGGLPLALAYAKYISCLNRTETDSCGECSSCRKYATFTHPDLHFSFPFPREKGEKSSEIIGEWRKAILDNPYMGILQWMQVLDAEKKQANIPLAECREISKSLSLKPFESEFKILLMWLPEYLGKEGNSLLKLIEEPPPNTVFLLVAENPDKILGTIISRTQSVRLKPIEEEALYDFLIKNEKLEEEKARRISTISQGDYTLLTDLLTETESPYFELLKAWMSICVRKSMPEIVAWSEHLGGFSKENLKGFLLYSIEILRGVVVFPHAEEIIPWAGRERVFIENFNKLTYSINDMELIVKNIEMALSNIERNGRVPLVLTDLSYVIARNLKK